MKRWQTAAMALMALSMGPALIACGSTCADIRSHRTTFSETMFHEVNVRDEAIHQQANARLTVPFALLDEVMNAELKRQGLPSFSFTLPMKLAGTDQATFSLKSLRVIAAEAGKIGIEARFAMMLNQMRGLDMAVEIAVSPMFSTYNKGRDARIGIRVEPRSLGRVQPELTEEGVGVLSEWVRGQLPKALQGLASKEMLKPLMDEALSFLTHEVWPEFRNSLGHEALFESHLVIPALRIGAIRTRSVEQSLVFDMVSQAQSKALPTRDAHVSGKRMALRMTGPVAAALVSEGMDEGRLPGRFDAKGKPKADGEWDARVAWRGGSKPVALHMWRTEGKCERAVVGAKVKLAIEGDVLGVRLSEGRLINNKGPAFAESFGWLQGIFGESLNGSFKTASFLSFETDSNEAQVRLARAEVLEEGVLLELDFGMVGRSKRRAQAPSIQWPMLAHHPKPTETSAFEISADTRAIF